MRKRSSWVFGWRTEQTADTDDFRYTTAWFGDQRLLGVIDGAGSPGGRAVELEDLLRRRGRRRETPYGRLAAATDPTGVVFNLSSLRS